VPKPSSRPETIRLRGVHQNNLKGFDIDLPLGKYIAVTGLSGSGKSSLVFDTLHAEGQRRYVETFSAYTRQFLDLLEKPDVDRIENIRPSIAIEQSNTVKTSRSTVGTMTELCDFFKVWFSHSAQLIDPDTGKPVHDDNPQTIWKKTTEAFNEKTILITFPISKPENLSWSEIFTSLNAQGYTRVVLPKSGLLKIDSIKPDSIPKDIGQIHVIQDRLQIKSPSRKRFLEATETALHFGQGQIEILDSKGKLLCTYSRGLHSPETGRTFRYPTPGLFSFNSPIGACPKCRGFGRVIEIDYQLAIPDTNLSLEDGAIRAFEGAVYGESKNDLLRAASRLKIPTTKPFKQLTAKQRNLVMLGEPAYRKAKKEEKESDEKSELWYGLKGFFDWMETRTYKMPVRVFLSRYRAYLKCPDCQGSRLQAEALFWKWKRFNLFNLFQLPISDLSLLMKKEWAAKARKHDHQADIALESIVTRLHYLDQVGLGYLTLDRTSRTLSGGEVERVNLTSCLGTSLVDTLFVLDEPSVGLHSRDIDRLIDIVRGLIQAGNTVVVVEHDEAMLCAADHIIEIGPKPGREGGEIVFQGTVPQMLKSSQSLTGQYFSGRKILDTPKKRRPIDGSGQRKQRVSYLSLKGVQKHNIEKLDVNIPLQRLVCLTGVSGSGKSTLLNSAIYQGIRSKSGKLTADPASIQEIVCDLPMDEVVLVDQSPISRTPRSNPALFIDIWTFIRELFAKTTEAGQQGFTASSFSFNHGDGRCQHCQGLGYERIEMQFLSTVFTPCPICESKRFKKETLSILWSGHSIADVLDLTVKDALELFVDHARVRSRLETLTSVGLDYLTLGQPLSTLSGGESQRLKLVKYLGNISAESNGSLLLLDEPTTGLHRHDVKRLISTLQKLIDSGHSIVMVEHNLDVIKSADWVIELGPEAGINGGKIVCQGTPETVAASKCVSATYLKEAIKTKKGNIAKSTKKLTSRKHGKQRQPDQIEILGARENNLQNIAVQIPHRKLSVVTGVSGSGKSTLAFDIIFGEGQRRFMESMSPYARQFVEQLPRPSIDRLTGIPPTVAIEQRITRGSRKSTVATITEVAQYLRLLFSKIGIQHNPTTGKPVLSQTPEQLLRRLITTLASSKAKRAKNLFLCAPLIRGRKGHHQPITNWIEDHAYEFMRIDGIIHKVSNFQKLDRYKEHDIEVAVIDFKTRNSKAPKQISSSLKEALRLGKGSCFLSDQNGNILAWFSTTRTDEETGEAFPELDPKHFSFNSPKGWCPTCRGHGRIFPWMLEPSEDSDLPPLLEDLTRKTDPDEIESLTGSPCPECKGERLNDLSRSVRIPLKTNTNFSLPELLRMEPDKLINSLRQLKLDRRGKAIATAIIPEIEERLKFMGSVGLNYLCLERPTDTLSGGEAQRIRLASQLGTNLAGVLYVLDEPSIGLHARDNERLIQMLEALRDKGNTLLVVEHDDAIMERADNVIDLGPGAGIHGGQLLANGSLTQLKKNKNSLTGRYLNQSITHPLHQSYRSLPPGKTKKNTDQWITLSKVTFRNLKNQNLSLPIRRLIMVAGVSGAGKSTLIRDLLGPAIETAIKAETKRLKGPDFLKKRKDFATFYQEDQQKPSNPFGELINGNSFKKVIEVDQSPIGKTPRSTPATYLGAFDTIRTFFASLPESKIHGYKPGRFSFNTVGGRCETCKGAGRIKLEMDFLPDAYLPCDDCQGSRYSSELADITWKKKTIAQILALTFEEAAEFFDFHSQLKETMQLMVDTGLGYLTLGQSSPTLSGGEAQRLKLVTELAKGLQTYTERSRGIKPQNLYILEEPTIGLHLSDCEKLIHVLHRLVNQGHTVIVIEHHADLLAEADYLVEIGPEGGPQGGKILYQGNLKGLLKNNQSPTKPYLINKIS
jgi:excinuclease ABC subunit A